LVEREDLFLFPGTDQILLCFQLHGDTPDALSLVVTDKLGHKLKRIPLSDFRKVICDYSGTLNNRFNFNVKLAKRAELNAESLIGMWRDLRHSNIERNFELDLIRDVGSNDLGRSFFGDFPEFRVPLNSLSP
jgi:hypothetical protein